MALMRHMRSQNTPVSKAQEQTIRYQLASFMRLWPYLWPADKPSYKLRTFLALIFTIAGQFVVVLAPFFLGRAIDGLGLQLEDLGLGLSLIHI